MKRKVIGILIGLLALSGVVGVGLAQAGSDSAKPNVQQVETGDAHENESSEVEDADEPGDTDGPGEEAHDD
jgi:hypothetical protein